MSTTLSALRRHHRRKAKRKVLSVGQIEDEIRYASNYVTFCKQMIGDAPEPRRLYWEALLNKARCRANHFRQLLTAARP